MNIYIISTIDIIDKYIFAMHFFACLNAHFLPKLKRARRQELGHELQEELQKFPAYWARATQMLFRSLVRWSNHASITACFDVHFRG